MSPRDDVNRPLPSDLQEVADTLREQRPTLSPLQLDSIKLRAMSRARSARRVRGAGRFSSRMTAVLAAMFLIGGTGGALACLGGNFGGNPGNAGWEQYRNGCPPEGEITPFNKDKGGTGSQECCESEGQQETGWSPFSPGYYSPLTLTSDNNSGGKDDNGGGDDKTGYCCPSSEGQLTTVDKNINGEEHNGGKDDNGKGDDQTVETGYCCPSSEGQLTTLDKNINGEEHNGGNDDNGKGDDQAECCPSSSGGTGGQGWDLQTNTQDKNNPGLGDQWGQCCPGNSGNPGIGCCESQEHSQAGNNPSDVRGDNQGDKECCLPSGGSGGQGWDLQTNTKSSGGDQGECCPSSGGSDGNQWNSYSTSSSYNPFGFSGGNDQGGNNQDCNSQGGNGSW